MYVDAGQIETEFRTFPMEVLAGDEDFEVSVKESGATFKFNFRDVYWNSRYITFFADSSLSQGIPSHSHSASSIHTTDWEQSTIVLFPLYSKLTPMQKFGTKKVKIALM